MPVVKRRASTILGELDQAQTELVGKAVILTDGKAGTVESVWLDEHHGLRISIRGHYGKWPISTIKLAQRSTVRADHISAANSGDSIPFAPNPLFGNLTEWDCTNEDHRPVICLRVDRKHWRPT